MQHCPVVLFCFNSASSCGHLTEWDRKWAIDLNLSWSISHASLIFPSYLHLALHHWCCIPHVLLHLLILSSLKGELFLRVIPWYLLTSSSFSMACLRLGVRLLHIMPSGKVPLFCYPVIPAFIIVSWSYLSVLMAFCQNAYYWFVRLGYKYPAWRNQTHYMPLWNNSDENECMQSGRQLWSRYAMHILWTLELEWLSYSITFVLVFSPNVEYSLHRLLQSQLEERRLLHHGGSSKRRWMPCLIWLAILRGTHGFMYCIPSYFPPVNVSLCNSCHEPWMVVSELWAMALSLCYSHPNGPLSPNSMLTFAANGLWVGLL